MRRRLEQIEQFAVEVIFDRQRGKRATLLRCFLHGLAVLYERVVAARAWLFARNIKRRHFLGTTVVSIGNLTVGGTGKTPVVERLARELRDAGVRVAILSRGYKSRRLPLLRAWHYRLVGRADPLLGSRVVSDGQQVLLGSYEAGDEPYMMAVNLPGVPVIVDKDRARAGRLAVERFGCRVLLLDDGFQYLRLSRRHDFVLVDCQTPFGNGWLLPRGMLREPPAALRRAGLVILTKSGETSPTDLIREIRRHQPTAPIIVTDHLPLHLQCLGGSEQLPLDFLQGKYVAVLSGIAAPESFERFVTAHGAHIEVRRRFADHHRYSPSEIAELIERCRRRDLAAVITTEKDAVRLPLPDPCPVPFYYLKVQIEIREGTEEWQRWLDRLAAPETHSGAYPGAFIPLTKDARRRAAANA